MSWTRSEATGDGVGAGLARGAAATWRATALAAVVLAAAWPALAGEGPPAGVVAEVLGKTVILADLDEPGPAGPESSAAEQVQRRREERLQGLVWSAVFGDYAARRAVGPTPAEVDSHIRAHRQIQARERERREQQRMALVAELGSTALSPDRRRQAQDHLDALERLRAFDAQQERERQDPAALRMWEDAERRVAEVWIRRWKVDQALHRQFGGRIAFQQAGWEPVDAYRALLEQYEASRAFVVHDPAFRDAVYAYFGYRFVYADERKARFYFEKPYWERTEAELRASGFR